MENKKPKGRRKIPMRKIENFGNLNASFSKRRMSLYKKASNLVFECDVDIGMIFFSPAGNPFSFFHPNVDAVVSRFQNLDIEPSESALLVAAHNREKVNELKNKLEVLDAIENIEIAKKQSYDEMINARQKGWWESIEQLNANEVSTYETWLKTIGFNVHNRLNQMEVGASSSDLGFNG
ncbi:agamous-like MADS-box protein AGL29 [Solanum pennellii]|uniref:Agamous-like MADS-box protein AGL29 n=1 Tax=Solanum pennellii TaxID=28526 RepID=A0ABM1V1B8_SOLPN|nr:agamous-like MADS-box protein AGL29 [Solanum pennellii]